MGGWRGRQINGKTETEEEAEEENPPEPGLLHLRPHKVYSQKEDFVKGSEIYF